MKHKIFLSVLILIGIMIFLTSLTGCGLFNLTDWVMPDDKEFIAIIETLNTPKKVCKYMEDNFEWKLHWSSYSPYQMWLANVKFKAGDCNDMSCFAVFVAHWHGYEVYQIYIVDTSFYSHLLGVFVENGGYTSSSNTEYYSWVCESFEDVVNIHRNNYISYKVYDYENNLIEVGN